jgi:hypothetical protein
LPWIGETYTPSLNPSPLLELQLSDRTFKTVHNTFLYINASAQVAAFQIKKNDIDYYHFFYLVFCFVPRLKEILTDE